MRQLVILQILFAAALAAQPGSPTVLTIEIDNLVEYLGDTADVMKLGTDPNITTPLLPNTFFNANHVADVISVNGEPAKGVVVQAVRVYGLSTAPTPSRPVIADVTRASLRTQYFEILSADGTSLGTIITSGMNLPAYAIVGGTGAFVGARGYSTQVAVTRPARLASASEDPSRRRIFGGGRTTQRLVIYPMTYPEVLTVNGQPAITRADGFTPISSARPAVAGEILSLFASGLGPVRSNIAPDEPFPSSPLAVVNSPVQVTVGGKPAEVLAAVGFPGSTNGYQVNFRVPDGVPPGDATVQISVAWIKASPVSMRLR
jgi:uncharacterized protein (TIGR03437 family)